MNITCLKLNGIPEPFGYDSQGPLLLSWLVENAAGKRPVSTHIRVWGSSDKTDLLWETWGDLSWEGTPLTLKLRPRTRYCVGVEVSGNAGDRAEGITWFETGKMDEPWAGRWIGPPTEAKSAPMLTSRFDLEGEIYAARLYITGLGLYAARLNGQPVTDELLTPGISDYKEEVQYQTYDVTALLRGHNRLEIALGNGWYKGRYGLEAAREPFGNRYAALAELHVVLKDGTEQVFGTDESWTWTNSLITADGIYEGEVLDRLAPVGLNRPVELVDVSLRVVERFSLPIREKGVLKAREVIHTPAGETVLDFGQNHAGLLRFCAALPQGTEVYFEFGEVLQGGNFYNENYRDARGGFRYRSDGREESVCQTFTFFGFRYVKVTGWPGEPDPADFESPVVYSDLDSTGELACGHPGVERLLKNVLWSQRSNFLDIPTDCPQRDERLGWTGDAQVFSPTACYFMDCRAFYRKFLRLLRTEQLRHDGAVPIYTLGRQDFSFCAIWSDAAVLIPDTLLRMTGCAAEVAGYYPMMKDWVDYVDRNHPNHLYDKSFQFGDWLALDGITENSFKGSTDDTYLATAYFYQSASLTARLAGMLGKAEDETHYNALAEDIRTAVMDTYFTPAGRLSVDTQTAYIIALRLGLYRNKEVLLEQFSRRLQYDNYQIRCGFVGAPLLCQTLAQEGMDRLACDFLLNHSFPSWLYCVDLGATTIWERWNSLMPNGACSATGMNSFNHYAYGSVAEYVFAWLGGLRPDGLGFRRAIIAPQPDARLGYLTCRCRTISGTYESAWQVQKDGTLSLHIEVPFGCTAMVTLPCSDRKAFEVQSGTYDYRYQPTKDLLAAYDWDSRLGQLAGDEDAIAVLGENQPKLFGMLQANDREFTTQTFRQLSRASFLGLPVEQMRVIIERLGQIRRVPGLD